MWSNLWSTLEQVNGYGAVEWLLLGLLVFFAVSLIFSFREFLAWYNKTYQLQNELKSIKEQLQNIQDTLKENHLNNEINMGQEKIELTEAPDLKTDKISAPLPLNQSDRKPTQFRLEH